MSISDRLAEIKARIVRARHGDHGDRYMVLDMDAPALVVALQDVLDLHKPEVYDGPGRICEGCDTGAMGTPTWPCETVRAISAALGEGA